VISFIYMIYERLGVEIRQALALGATPFSDAFPALRAMSIAEHCQRDYAADRRIVR
jgi:hypothetical protein